MQKQFQKVQPWISSILSEIKKEIKVDHLPSNPSFTRTHFGNRPLSKLTTEEIFAAYEKTLLAGDTELGEWVVSRWVFKNGEIYVHFEGKLSEISEDYSTLTELTGDQSEKILEGAIEKFGALQTYLFSVLNEVVFPETVFQKLRTQTEKEEAEKKQIEKSALEERGLGRTIENHQREMIRLQEKYENKIAGIMKKYSVDMAALKKQIRSLQQQLNTK